MKRIAILCISISFLIASNTIYAKPYIVATTADMASITKNIAGDLIELKTIFNGQSDMHFFEPRPQHIVWLNKADMIVVAGLSADEWVYPLLQAARNPKIQIGKQGFLDPSVGVQALDIPSGKIDGSLGHVHPDGNPHYWLNEENLIIATRNITAGLIHLMPDQENTLVERQDAFIAKINEQYQSLRAMMLPFKSISIIQYHTTWNYFCADFNIHIAANFEPLPGVPPTPGHLKELQAIIRADQVKLIIAEPYYPSKPLITIVSNSPVGILRIPFYTQKNEDIIDHLRTIVTDIVEELSQ